MTPAIRMPPHHPQEVVPVRRPGPPERDIHPLIADRWSPRAIDPARPVERATLLTLLEAARWAPSCFNDQPWRYLIFDLTNPRQLHAARDCLVEGNAWTRRAPTLLLSVARKTFRHNGKPNRMAVHDVGAASALLCLQATAAGLVAHQMAGFDASLARERFHIPADCEVLAMIALGYPGDVASLSESQQERERAPRERLPLSEIAAEGDWEAPLRED